MTCSKQCLLSDNADLRRIFNIAHVNLQGHHVAKEISSSKTLPGSQSMPYQLTVWIVFVVCTILHQRDRNSLRSMSDKLCLIFP